jgi:hypothetical protein
MPREDILGGLKNALERGDSVDEAKETFISAGYSKAEVEDAAASLEKLSVIRKAEVPAIYSATLQAPSAKPGEKPLPQIKVERKFHYWLIAPILLISALIAYLIYNILLSQ